MNSNTTSLLTWGQIEKLDVSDLVISKDIWSFEKLFNNISQLTSLGLNNRSDLVKLYEISILTVEYILYIFSKLNDKTIVPED